MFILLCSEKNEPRSAAAVIGLCRSEAGATLGGCGTRYTQTVLAFILGRLASSRPDKGGRKSLYIFSFLRIILCRAFGPRIVVRGDGEGHSALDAVSRKYSGVMPGDVHSSQQREERTKKRRRGYRALSLGGWHRPRGLRNSLSSDSPRPYPRSAGLLPAR